MELVIKLNENGEPLEHPILLENMIYCDSNFNIDNLPTNYKKFIRVTKPIIGPYDVLESQQPIYVIDGDVVKDHWPVREMNASERQEKINTAIINRPHQGWIFDEATCTFSPPVPYPDTGEKYIWNDSTVNWELYVPGDDE
jgi:hypothetical protein